MAALPKGGAGVFMTIGDGARNVRSLARSFKYAWDGIAYCIRNERNMRIHLTVIAYVIAFSFFYDFDELHYAVLFLCFGLVLFAEAVNTAIEAMVNLEAESYKPLARIAKDVAAGAVLITALCAFVIGCWFFIKPDKIRMIVDYLSIHLFLGIAFLISLPLAVMFIFLFPFKIRPGVKKRFAKKR